MQRFFQSPNQVLENVCLPTDQPEVTQQFVTTAMRRGKEWPTASPGAVKDLVRRVVRRVVVYADRLEVQVSRSEVRRFLSDEKIASSSRTARTGNLDLQQDDLIRLRVEATVKRCSGEMRLVVGPNSDRASVITPILAGVARAYTWREAVLAGELPNRITTAKTRNRNQEYLRRLMSCAFLAPDIVQAILDGHHPPDLTLKKLSRRRLPLNWGEQRVQLGLSLKCGNVLSETSWTSSNQFRKQGIEFPC